MVQSVARKTTGQILTILLLVLIGLVVVLPILWIVLSSFQPGTSLFSSSLIPESFTGKHYVTLFTDTDFPRWFLNTLRIAVINMVVGVIITSMTAFGFSRYYFKIKQSALTLFMVLQMFPSFLAMTAIFIILGKLQLLNSYWGLLLIYAAGQVPFNTWVLKGYFDNISRSLDEAARIDGASEFRIFMRVIFPLGRPALVLVAFRTFMTPWMDFIMPSLILREESQKTIALGIFEWVSYEANENFTMFAAAAILISIPITLLFGVLQKSIVTGMTAGATKG